MVQREVCTLFNVEEVRPILVCVVSIWPLRS